MRHSFASEQEAQRDGLAQNNRWLFGLRLPFHYRYDPPQVPSGFLISSAEDMAHFLVAQLNGGRFGSTSVLSPESIAAMHAPGVPMGGGSGKYGLGWRTELLGGVPAVLHTGDHPDVRTLVFIEPGTRRGAVLLVNASGWLPTFGTFKEIEGGVARLLAEQEPAPTSSLSLRMRYLIVNAVLAGLFALALWPLLRLRRWDQRLRQHYPVGWLRRLGISLRLLWEFGVPLVLLVGVRLFLEATVGTQSWSEILLLFPDVGPWIWATSLLLLLTEFIRVTLILRGLRRGNKERGISPSVATTTRNPV
jgi:hypothetical protein